MKQLVFKSLRVSSYLWFLYDGAIFWRTTNPFGQRQSTFGCQIVRYMPIVRCSRGQLRGPMFPRQTTWWVFCQRVLHVTWITILHIDVNCVLTPFIYLVVMSYVTGILLVTTLTAIRWHFWEGRKESLWQTRNDTIRNSNQFETAIGAFVCFNLHQWSLVYLMFYLACMQIFGVWTKAEDVTPIFTDGSKEC